MTEILFYILTDTLPFHLFAYIPFWNHLKFSKRTTLILLFVEQFVYMLGFSLLFLAGIPVAIAQLFAIPLYGTLFFFFVNMDKGKVAFLYIFTTDYLMLITGIVSFIGRTWLHFDLFTVKAGIYMLLFFFLTVPVMLWYIRKTAKTVFAIHAPLIWKSVWLLPLFTSSIVLICTYPAAQASLQALAARTLLMICMFLIYYYIIQALQQVQKIAIQQEQARSMERLMKIQAEQYALIQSRIEETRRARHDLRQHWIALKECIDSGSKQALADYVKNYGESLASESISIFSPNPLVNAVLNFYAEKAIQENIAIDISFQTEEKTVIPEPEFCVLLGNLLENALDSSKAFEGESFIRVNARQNGHHMLTLTVDNTSSLPPDTKGENLYSSKHAGIGIGTASIRMIAKKHNGDARFEWKDGIFYACVILNP